MKHAFLRLPHRKCMGKSLIGCRCWAKHLNEKMLKYFSGSRSTTNEPNFKILYNCIHELLNVFEDSAQRVHTIHTHTTHAHTHTHTYTPIHLFFIQLCKKLRTTTQKFCTCKLLCYVMLATLQTISHQSEAYIQWMMLSIIANGPSLPLSSMCHLTLIFLSPLKWWRK